MNLKAPSHEGGEDHELARALYREEWGRTWKVVGTSFGGKQEILGLAKGFRAREPGDPQCFVNSTETV